MKHKGSTELRSGYTTGACACAATLGCLQMLFTQKLCLEVKLKISGVGTVFTIHEPCFSKNQAGGYVIKDAGDDIDITDGAHIVVEIRKTETPGIQILAGSGVGTFTKTGLSGKTGEPAVNPTPRKNLISLIKRFSKAYNYDLNTAGLSLTISIPGGEELALKTLNPKLGIKGGLSILGTTGRVNPLSKDAFIKTIELELSQIRSAGKSRAVFVFGNSGERFAKKIGIDESLVIQISNYLGDALDIAKEYGYKDILIIGGPGKLIKVAGGIFQTHSKAGDAKKEILIANLALYGADRTLLEQIDRANTTEEMIKLIRLNGYDLFFDQLIQKIKIRLDERSMLNCNVILFTRDSGVMSTLSKEEIQKIYGGN